MWTKIKEFIKKNWLALISLITSIFTFIFYRNRRSGLGSSEQLCSDIGDGITETKQSITDSKSEVESVRADIDELAGEAKTAGDVVRKYQTGSREANKIE